jgi:hypothetical protein
MLPLFLLALAAVEPEAAAPTAEAPPPAMAAMLEKKPTSAEAGNLPNGAPTDDYGFVAWCHGALNGHMQLYETVKPELAKLERSKKDAEDNAKIEKEQMEAGRDYLALYSRALIAAERASPNNIHERGVQADTQGYKMWAPAQAMDEKNRMWAWLTWELPARCETAAKRLEERSSLFAETFRRGGPAEPAAKVNTAVADAPADAPKAPDIGIPAEN